MASGPETRFITSVHKHLPPVDQFHREKMANPYRSGTADSWYSGKRDLWVEWKWVELPKRPDTIIDITAGKKPSLNVLQQDWIKSRLVEGREVWVVVGCKEGGVVFRDAHFMLPHRTDVFTKMCLSRLGVASSIFNFCNP